VPFPVVQLEHATPLAPHAVSMKPASQTPVASQQPVQLAALQTVELLHAFAVQVAPLGQTVQAAPPPPQTLVVVPAWQTPLMSQQPLQLPGPQAAASGPWQKPNWQVLFAGQVVHAMPPKPQLEFVSPVTQVLPWQQPKGHVPGPQGGATHAPLVHVSSAAQSAHALPPVPQAEVLVPVTHSLLMQQPLGHVVGLQLVTACSQRPAAALQVKFVGHASQFAPPVPHALLALPAWQNELALQQPPQLLGPHAGSWQKPCWQVSPKVHCWQKLPKDPQSLLVVPVWQTLFTSQQPFGQFWNVQGAGAHTC